MVPSPFLAEAVAGLGFDYLCLDQQHGLFDHASLVATLQATEGRGPVPMSRVTCNDPGLIGRALDAGAHGVVVPLVETAEEAAAAVAACRYPPQGARSFGPLRAGLVAGTLDPAELGTALCLVMVETRRGLENVGAIAATPGVDGIYIGPADLALGLGLAPRFGVIDPPTREAITAIREACQREDIVAGIQANTGGAARAFADEGFLMVTVATDVALLTRSAAAELGSARPRATDDSRETY